MQHLTINRATPRDTNRPQVCCLQADAVRVVTGGADGRLRVFDVMTGESVQTIPGHPCAILDIQCDASRMVSAGTDGSIKRWVWASAPSASDEASGNANEYEGAATKHIFGPGDSMKKLSMAYNTPLAKLLEYNKMKEASEAYIGMQVTASASCLVCPNLRRRSRSLRTLVFTFSRPSTLTPSRP